MSGSAEHDLYKRRAKRNLAVAALLGAFVLLMFTLTIVKLGQNAEQPFHEYTETVGGGRAPHE